MTIRAERVFEHVFELLTGRNLEQIRRSQRFKRLYRKAVEQLDRRRNEFRSNPVEPQNKTQRGSLKFSLSGESARAISELGIEAFAEEFALVMLLERELSASAKRAVPAWIRKTLTSHRSPYKAVKFVVTESRVDKAVVNVGAPVVVPDTDKKIASFESTFEEIELEALSEGTVARSMEILLEWFGMAFADYQSTLPEASAGEPLADEKFQPLERSLPELAIRNQYVPNCVGKAQLLFACADMEGLQSVGFIPMRCVADIIATEKYRLIQALVSCVRRNHKSSTRLERHYNDLRRFQQTRKGYADRLHIAPCIYFDGCWMMFDEHQQVVGDLPETMMVETRYQVLQAGRDQGAVEATSPVGNGGLIAQRIRQTLDPVIRECRELLRVHTNLLAHRHSAKEFFQILRGQAALQWSARRDRRRSTGSSTDEWLKELCNDVAALLMWGGQMTGDESEATLIKERLSNFLWTLATSDGPKAELGKYLQLVADQYLELSMLLLVEKSDELCDDLLSEGMLVHEAGEFMASWRISAVAVLSHAGLELGMSDEVEEMLCSHSSDRYREMYRAARPLRMKRKATAFELEAERALRARPAKSFHVRDLLSRLRDHQSMEGWNAEEVGRSEWGSEGDFQGVSQVGEEVSEG